MSHKKDVLSPPQPPPLAINAFNVLRAFICLQIMGMHFFYHAQYDNMNPWFGKIGRFFFTKLYVGSESFFVIAGYFLAYGFRPGNWSYLSVSSFFVRRFSRLILPFWAAILLGLLFGEFGRLIHEHLLHSVSTPDSQFPNLRQILPTAFCVVDLIGYEHLNMTFWFMSPLIQFLLIWGLLFWIVRKSFLYRRKHNFHFVALRVMIVLTAIIFASSLACHCFQIETRWILARKAMFLCLGCFSYWSSIGINRFAFNILIASSLSTMFAGVALQYPQCFWSGLTAILIPFLIDWRGAPRFYFTRLFDWIGGFSFSVYLTHMYVGSRLLQLSVSIKHDWNPLAAFAVYLLAMAISVLAAYAFFIFIEKPAANWTKTIRYLKEHNG